MESTFEVDLKEVGKIAHTKGFERYLLELKGMVNQYTDLMLSAEFTAQVHKLRQNVEQAMATLSSDELPFVSAEDVADDQCEETPYDRACEALTFFTDIVWLYEAVKYLGGYGRMPEEAAVIMADIQCIYDRVVGWLKGDDFSIVRLIPLNECRKGWCRNISPDNDESVLSVFPWLSEHRHCDSNSLYDVCQDYRRLINKDESDFNVAWLVAKFGIPCGMALHNGFAKDRKLFELVKKGGQLAVNIDSSLRTIVGMHSALLLWKIAELEGHRHMIPLDVVRRGYSKTIIRFLGDIGSDIREKLQAAFLCVFCGPVISSQQRLVTMEEIAESLSTIPMTEISADDTPTLHLLNEWFYGSLSHDKLIEHCFGRWNELLGKTAQGMPANTGHDSNAEEVLAAVKKVQAAVAKA